jgi:hypothetical protein
VVLASPVALGDARPAVEPAALADVLAARGEVLRSGSWKNAEVRRVTVDGRPLIVKDWRCMAPWMRPVARHFARRERRLYGLLRRLPSVPRVLAAGDRVLVIEHVPGRRISRFQGRPEAAMVARAFAEAVAAMHAAGVYHLDLRKRDNALVEDDGTVHLIDFTAGAAPTRYGPLAPLIRRVAARVDRYAVLKWTEALAPDLMTAADRRLLARMDRWRLKRRED